MLKYGKLEESLPHSNIIITTIIMIKIKEEDRKLLVYQDNKLIATDNDVGIIIQGKEEILRATLEHLIEHMRCWAENNADKTIISIIPKSR